MLTLFSGARPRSFADVVRAKHSVRQEHLSHRNLTVSLERCFMTCATPRPTLEIIHVARSPVCTHAVFLRAIMEP